MRDELSPKVIGNLMARMLALAALALFACADAPTGSESAPVITDDPCTCVADDGSADDACLTGALGELGPDVCVALRCELGDGLVWRRHVCAPAAGG